MLWSDHGYHLGEAGLWNKHTNFELATHVPLLFRSPNQLTSGTESAAPSELVDIYPTLCDLAGLANPNDLEGSTLAPFIMQGDASPKRVAFSQYPRRAAMGYSVRDKDFRYTEWRKANGEVIERELYDYRTHGIETENLAGKTAHERVQTLMSTYLLQGWRGAAKP